MFRKIALGLIAAASLVPVAASATATQIILDPSKVYATSGQYGPLFAADNILDQQTGTLSEPGQIGTYWLNADNGPAAAYISVDLGAAYRLDHFELFNTHNGGYNDRGTGAFSIRGSNVADFSTYSTLVSGTLASQTLQNDPLDAQIFAVSNFNAFRYIQFRPTSVAAGRTPCCGANVYGLNELRVFGAAPAVPEPATWAMMLVGVSAIGSAMRSRKRVAVAA